MAADSNSINQVRSILSNMRTASLGTLASDGSPFLSLVTIAPTSELQSVMLLSGLAVHTRNLQQDGRCSLLLVERGGEDGNPLAGARLTLTGRAVCLDRSEDADKRAAFLTVHPEAAMYADFGDFTIWCFELEAAHLVAGFGRIVSVRADDLR